MAVEVALGSGSIGEGDRIGPGAALAMSGAVTYMGFDCLAERTLALAERRRYEDESAGQDERVADFVSAYAPFLAKGGRMVANFGAANPDAAGVDAVAALRKAGLEGVRVGVIRGDDVFKAVMEHNVELPERGCRASEANVVSAHAYIGADPVVELLEQNTQLISGGRLADASEFVRPRRRQPGRA